MTSKVIRGSQTLFTIPQAKLAKANKSSRLSFEEHLANSGKRLAQSLPGSGRQVTGASSLTRHLIAAQAATPEPVTQTTPTAPSTNLTPSASPTTVQEPGAWLPVGSPTASNAAPASNSTPSAASTTVQGPGAWLPVVPTTAPTASSTNSTPSTSPTTVQGAGTLLPVGPTITPIVQTSLTTVGTPSSGVSETNASNNSKSASVPMVQTGSFVPIFHNPVASDGVNSWNLNHDYFATLQTVQWITTKYGTGQLVSTPFEGRAGHIVRGRPSTKSCYQMAAK
jgi:hypothetical protein